MTLAARASAPRRSLKPSHRTVAQGTDATEVGSTIAKIGNHNRLSFGFTQGAVSQHLRVLRDAGIVVREKRGYYVHYMIDDAKLREVREAVCAFLSGGGGSTGKPKGEKRCARGRSAARSRKK